jgi:hypothetical protein
MVAVITVTESWANKEVSGWGGLTTSTVEGQAACGRQAMTLLKDRQEGQIALA